MSQNGHVGSLWRIPQSSVRLANGFAQELHNKIIKERELVALLQYYISQNWPLVWENWMTGNVWGNPLLLPLYHLISIDVCVKKTWFPVDVQSMQ